MSDVEKLKMIKDKIDELVSLLIDLSMDLDQVVGSDPTDGRRIRVVEPEKPVGTLKKRRKRSWEDEPASAEQISYILKLREMLGEELSWAETQRLKKAADQGLLTKKKASDRIEELKQKLREKRGGGNGK